MILVTGATGTIGLPLTELLVRAGAQVRAVTRNPDTQLPAGVEKGSSLQGVTSLFLNPRAVGKTVDSLLEQAREHGVRRVVALSAFNVDDDLAAQPSRYRGDLNKEVEDAAVGSGLDWVSLRPSMFAMNTAGLWGGQLRAGDVATGAYAKAEWAPLHEMDIAEAAARVLLSGDYSGQRLVLTGPLSHTQEDMVAIIGHVLGRDVRYQEIPPQVARQGIIGSGFPPGFADAFLALQAKAAGQPAVVTNEVEKILGRRALGYAEWVADHKEAFQR